MGCGASISMDQVYPEEWLTNFEALQFSKQEVVKLEKFFHRIDDSADGRLDLHELLDYLDIKNSNFAKRSFSIFDEDSSGSIDFREFVLSLWNFCSCADSSLRMFAFDLYDTDASGKIDASEVENMLREVYGGGYDSSQHASRLMEKISKICAANSIDRTINAEQFSQFARDNPALLFPAFELQRKIQRKVMGVEFWDRHLERRVELTHGAANYISVKQILQSKLNARAFDELVNQPLQRQAEQARERNTPLRVNEHAKVAVNSAGTRGHRNSGHGDAAFGNAMNSAVVANKWKKKAGSAQQSR